MFHLPLKGAGSLFRFLLPWKQLEDPFLEDPFLSESYQIRFYILFELLYFGGLCGFPAVQPQRPPQTARPLLSASPTAVTLLEAAAPLWPEAGQVAPSLSSAT